MSKRKSTPISTIICVSDLHCGCRMGLCPKHGVELDGGSRYEPSYFQHQLCGLWEEF